jgi:hypothetical protein
MSTPSRCLAWAWIASTAAAGCGGQAVHAPISPEAARIRYAEAPQPGCTKMGRARGVGTDPDERVAARRALDAARVKAAELGGDLIVHTDRKVVPDAEIGGMSRVEQAVDVYGCDPPLQKGQQK